MFAVVVILTILVGCGAPSEAMGEMDAPAERPEFYVPLPPPCGSASDYLNMPMTLNDGSGAYVPFAGSVPAGNGATIPILAPVGAALNSITVRVHPASHTSLNGELLPTLELRKVGQDGVESRVGNIAWDPYAIPGSTYNPGSVVASNYSATHDITLLLSGTIVSNAFYFLTFSQEWGGGQAQAGVVCGTKMVYSPSGL